MAASLRFPRRLPARGRRLLLGILLFLWLWGPPANSRNITGATVIAIWWPFDPMFIFMHLQSIKESDNSDSGSEKPRKFPKTVEGGDSILKRQALSLADGAEMRSATRQQDAADGRLAPATRFVGAQIHIVAELKEAAFSVRTNVVGNRRSAQTDGLAQNLAERLAQALQLHAGQAAGAAAGADSGTEKTFIGIDVAHPGQQFLIE